MKKSCSGLLLSLARASLAFGQTVMHGRGCGLGWKAGGSDHFFSRPREWRILREHNGWRISQVDRRQGGRESLSRLQRHFHGRAESSTIQKRYDVRAPGYLQWRESGWRLSRRGDSGRAGAACRRGLACAIERAVARPGGDQAGIRSSPHWHRPVSILCSSVSCADEQSLPWELPRRFGDVKDAEIMLADAPAGPRIDQPPNFRVERVTHP